MAARGLRSLHLGTRVVLDGDGMDDERAEHLVDMGFGFHEVAVVTSPALLVGGHLVARLDRGHGHAVHVLERELRRLG